jgi:fibronectin type 3 domain-containing protein
MHAPRSFLTLFGVIFAFFLNAATNLYSEDDFPISKDNLQLWLDANAGIVTDENGKVERWEDQSGKGNHAYQTNPANRPAIGVDAQSHRSVTFAAYSRQSLILPGVLKDASSGEMLIVLKSTAPARETRVLGQFGFSNRSDYYPDSYGAINSGFGSSANVYMGYPRININQWHLFNISAKAGSWMARLNGLRQYAQSSVTPSFTGMLSLGGNADPGYSYTYFFDGNISEILVFDRTLSDPERMLIEKYIHDKTQMLRRPPPVAPSNLTAQNLGAGEVCLTWNNGADKSIASEYTVERNFNNTGWVTIGTLEGSADYYIDSVPQAGDYDYRVRIRNWDGESEYSDEAHISVQTGSSYSLPMEGLALWLRADVGISLDSDNKVENWANVGGQGGAATQSDAAIRPSWETDEFGNQMVSFASFEATSVPKALQLSAVMRGANAGEIFAVLKSRSNASSVYSQVLWRMGYSYDLYPAKNGLFASCFGTDTSRAAGDANMDVSKWHVYNTASKAGEWTARLNGRLLYRTTNNTPNFSYDMQIGLSSYSYSYMPFHGDIAEIVMYDRVLDDAEREAVELYLGARLKQQAAPAAPTDVRAKIVGDTVEVSWFSAHDDGWSRYEVERKNDSGVFEKIGVVGGDDRTYVDANIQPGRAYAYQVRKTTWAGTSSDDNGVSIETPARLGMALPKNGLRLWMKADAGVIASPSGAVNTWLDQSGFSNHGTQLSSSNQPAIDVTAQNRNIVFSANSNQTLGFGGILQEPKAGEYFVVYKSTASPETNGRALWAWDDYCPDFGGNFKSGFLTKTPRTFARPPVTKDSWHVYNISSKPDEWTVRVNGIEHYKALKNEIYPVNSYSATLGGIPNAGACLDAEVAEILIYDRVLDGAEREAVGAYLSARHESLDVQPPAAPPLTSKEAGRGQIAVTWDAPEERAWVEYVLERSDGGDTWTVVARMQAGSRGYIDSNLTAGTYHYRMKVRNWAGESAYSDDVTATLTQASAATLPVSGLSLWLRADTGVIAGDDGAVESWNDLSGRGFNATQPAAANRPVAAMNGTRHAVRFDRAKNQRLILPTVLPEGAQRGEIFAILKAGAAKPSATAGLWTWGSGVSYYPASNGRIHESFGGGSIELGMPCTDISQWHSYNVTAAAGDWVVRLNGLVQYRTIARNGNPVFPSAPQIGYGNGYYFDGDIAEILVFDRVLDAAERAALETYAQERLQFIANPEAPLNLRAAPGAYGQIDLLWDSDPETGWTEYVIERKAAEAPLTEFAGVARVATHGWSDDTVTPGQKYVYRVKALSRTAGSGWSNDAEAVAPVKPSDVALPAHEGLRLWLRAGMGTVVDSDSRVKSWMDLSGKGNNLDQFDPAFRPLLASENGGRPSVRFSSARKDNFSLREIMQNAGAGEAFVVVKAASARPSSPGRGLWRLGNSNNNNAYYYPNSSGQLSDDFGRGAIQNMGNPVADIGQWHVYNVSASPESWIARLNGIEQHRAGSGAVGWHATPLLGGNGSYYFDGEIAEILIYDRVLDDGERTALHRYLMAATDVTPEPVPDAPSALDAQSDTPDAVRVSWQLPETFTQGVSYVLKRQTGTGSYEEVFRFNVGYETHMDYTDHDVSPGQEYTYCMMAVDWRGRESADSGTATVTVPASTGEAALKMRAGLRLWLRSDFGMVRTPDGYVAIWKDQSGLDNHATQGTPANRPALPASDNMPMSFDAGKSQYFTLPSSLVEGAVSGEAYVIVKARNAKSSSTRGLWRLGASSYYPYPSSGVIHDGFGSTSGHPMGTPVLDIADWRVYNVSSAAGSWTARLDGVEQYTTTTNTVGWGNSLALGLGESYFDGEIAEILIFDRILDTTERESVNRYLLSRAGLPEGAGPTAPTIEAWSENSDAINVEWQLPATHDCGIEYILERESGDSGFSEILSFAGGFAARRDFTDWNVSAGQTYTYRMKARDWLGRESAYGNEASVTVPGGPAPDVLPVRAGLALWLRADAGILGASDGRVTVWEDQSGRGNHARQGNVPQQPRLETSEGVASVSFDTSNNSCFALPHVMQNAQGGEIFAILKAAPATDRARGLWMFAYEDSTYGYTTYYPDTNGTIGDRFGSNTLHRAGTPLFDIKQWHLYNVTAATGNWTSRLNGNIQYHSDANTISWHNAPLLGSNGGYGFVGNIAELLVFERVLSGEERALVTAYLNKRHVLDGGAQAPETPSGLTGKIVLGNRAVLDWQGEVSPWIEYELARKEAGGGYVSIARQRGTHYVDLALSPNQTYTYHVRAINAAGTSAYGNEVELQAPPSADPLFPASNLRLWLDADREAGGALIQWTDWSGRDNHGSKGSIPVAICVDEEGRKVARFSSVSGQQSDFGDVLSGATEGEIFIVLRASTNARNPLWTWGNTLAYHPENANALSDGFGRGMTGNYQRVNLGYPIAGLDRKHLYNISSKTGEWVVRLDGGVQYKETGGSHVFAAGAFTLGYAFDGDGWVNRMFSGDIAELLLFDRVLTEAERGTVGKYLQAHHEFVPEKAPETPRNARARAVAANCVDVTWDFISESIDTMLIIERHSGDGDFAIVAKLPHYSNYSWLDTTVEAGAHYTYRLKAVNWFGESLCSDDAGVVVPHEGGGLPVDGLRTWLRSDAGVMRTQEGFAYRWTDQSGKGNHAAQTTASLRPGFGLRTDKARPVVTFDPAKNQYVTFDNIMSGAPAGEVFVVLKSNVKTGTTRALWAFGSNSYSFYPYSTGALHDNFGANTARDLGVPTADISLWHVFNVSSRPNEWIARLNGQEQTRLTANTVGFSGSPYLGRNGSYYFDGEIAEIMVYDRVLDDGERMAVNEYLNARHFSTALPVFVPAPGLYQAPVDVKLTGFGESDEVYYTTDGSEPQRGVSPRYTPGESIHIASVTRLRARAWTGDTGGKIADGMYAFGTEWPVASATSGLAAEFGRSAVFGAETTHARLDSQVDLTKSADVPGGLADALYSAYAVRWAGELLISRTEPHTLTIDVHGGIRLALNGGVVLDQMSLATSRSVTHTFNATAGDRIPITLEYAKPSNTPAPKITLSWNGVSFSRETIPAASLASGLAHVETLETPSATPPAGVVLELTEASLSATPANAIIRYTLDGSAPTAESPRYLQPVKMTTDTTIRARAWLDGKNPSGTLVARYTVDHAGPALSNLTFEDAPVPATISRSGRFGVTATALAGVSRVEFTLDGQPLGAAVSGNQTFFIAFDINAVADGAHTIAATATDRLGRQSTPLEATFTVAMAPPPAPVITSPSIGDRFSNASITVKGAAQQNTGITLYLKTSDATEVVAAQTTAGPDGRFSALIQLQPGQNQLSATARNRASQPSERSMTVTVDLDTTAPTEPRNLAARSQAGGRISLSWQAPASGIVSGYRVYRAAAPMTSPDQGTAIGGLITSRAHVDLPEADGAWHYLVVAVKSAADGELAGPPTASVEAVSDRVAPVVSALSYKSAGAPHDQAAHRFGAGPVAVSFTTSEALTASPALTLMTSGGQTVLVSVKRESETAFTGVATIPADAAGEITPVFSGYDAAGNQGTVVENAGPALCDTAGPRVTALQPVTPKPGLPGHDDAPSFTTVKNEPAPVTLYWRVTYDEAPSGTPAFGATVTGGESPREPLACEMLPDPANAGAWIACTTSCRSCLLYPRRYN